jgi:hypothetical protein
MGSPVTVETHFRTTRKVKLKDYLLYATAKISYK